ncbi:hypothetical protein [Pseudomonas viridiflava]|nr:hypothetical protein [Pseudomonas viridiflava]
MIQRKQSTPGLPDVTEQTPVRSPLATFEESCRLIQQHQRVLMLVDID